MAYRELGVIELREVWRRYSAGDGVRAIARGTGVDRKTIAKYVAAAVAGGPCTAARPRRPRTNSPPSGADCGRRPSGGRTSPWGSAPDGCSRRWPTGPPTPGR